MIHFSSSGRSIIVYCTRSLVLYKAELFVLSSSALVRFEFLCMSGVRPWDSRDFWLNNSLEQLWRNSSSFWGKEKFLAKKILCLDIVCIIQKIPKNKCDQWKAWTSANFFLREEKISKHLFGIHLKQSGTFNRKSINIVLYYFSHSTTMNSTYCLMHF